MHSDVKKMFGRKAKETSERKRKSELPLYLIYLIVIRTDKQTFMLKVVRLIFEITKVHKCSDFARSLLPPCVFSN